MRPVPLAAGGLVALAAAIGIGRFVYTPILPFMVEGLSLSQSEAGLIASANYAGYLIGALLAALPGLPGSRRAWLLGALALNALTTLLMGLGATSAFLLTVRFGAGVASAFVFVFASTLVLDRLAASGRSGLSALHFAGVGSGISFAAILVSVAAGQGVGWRELWFISAAAAAVALVVVAFLIPNSGPVASPAAPRTTPRRGLKRLIVAYGLFGFGYVITATFLVALVREAPQMRSVEPVIWLIVGLAALPSVAIWNQLGRAFGIYRMFALGCIVEAAGVTASVLWTSVAGAVVAAVLLGGTFVGITALGIVGARRLVPANPYRTLALMTAVFSLGQIIGPAFAGLAYDLSGTFTWPSMAAAAGLVVAALLTVRIEEQPADVAPGQPA